MCLQLMIQVTLVENSQKHQKKKNRNLIPSRISKWNLFNSKFRIFIHFFGLARCQRRLNFLRYNKLRHINERFLSKGKKFQNAPEMALPFKLRIFFSKIQISCKKLTQKQTNGRPAHTTDKSDYYGPRRVKSEYKIFEWSSLQQRSCKVSSLVKWVSGARGSQGV